jgi:hypothetical protein
LARQPEQGQEKKLTDAAEYWVTGGVKDQAADDLKLFGIEAELPEDKGFEVWPENWDALLMWCRVQTQWRTSVGGPVGLDYSVLAWLFKMYSVDDQRALLEDLQIMEGAALTAMIREG